ncbi:response regulator [Hyalangium versicolor]|uniref:response regulator n=1 Tax=Hyalangium versicolor TaxID=2861190 RepID=UPI001CCE876B|nr:response regulator [Hyalangium versicolor]
MGRTVLILDDSESIRYIIRVYLMTLKLDFLDADRAERGLRLLGACPVDLIIADVNMPGMNGLEFVRKVRADDREEVRRVPIILLTADKSPHLVDQSEQVGANALIHKPIGSMALTEVVCRYLQVSTPVSDDFLSPTSSASPSDPTPGKAFRV